MKHPIHKQIKWWLIDTKNAFKRAYKRTKYKVNGGYACSCCGALLPVYYDSIHSIVNGREIMISNYSHDGKIFCPKCLLDNIDTYFKIAPGIDFDGNLTSKTRMCAWTPKEGDITIPWVMRHASDLAKALNLNVRFGWRWWNGHHACLQTFQEALMNPKLTYSTGMIAKDPKDGVFKYRDINGIFYQLTDKEL